MKNNFRFALLSVILISVLTGCVKKEPDSPPEITIPTGNILTIQDLYQIYNESIVQMSESSYKFIDDYSVYAVVTMDDKTGNIYKSAYVQSGGYAVNLHLLSSGGIYEGDSVRIYLKGLVLSSYMGMLQLDSVNVDKHIFKMANQKNISPTVVTIPEIVANSTNPMYTGKLVQIDSVEFIDPNQTWADPVNLTSENRLIIDKAGNTMIVRSSGYASFAGDSLPKGNGTIIGIYSPYGSDLQLYIRRPSELSMDGNRTIILSKTFDDSNILSGGWTNLNVSGNISWYADANYGNPAPCAVIKNYQSGANYACETWYVSPSIDLSNTSNPVLSFESACNYSGANIEVYISTDYNPSNSISSATWTMLNPTLSAGSFVWTSSGDVDLSSYKTNGVYIGFKYTGTTSDGKTWEVDNILIKDKN